jgi:hypothetical protein
MVKKLDPSFHKNGWFDFRPILVIVEFDPDTDCDRVKVLCCESHNSPQGDSPFGYVDMAGNVCKWTQSIYKAYPYDPTDGCKNFETSSKRIMRGSSFGTFDPSSRVTFRYELFPSGAGNIVGFHRACLTYY